MSMKICNKRKVSSKTTIDCGYHQEQQQLKRKNSSKKMKMKKVTNGSLNSPTFNIHIHIPKYNKISGSKFYLPKVQPVFHLHFDEIAKRINMSNISKSEESLCRAFQNIFQMTSPKFRDVKFHFENKSRKGNTKLLNNTFETPQRKRCSDSQLCNNKAKKKICFGNSDNSNSNCDNNDDKNISNKNSELTFNNMTSSELEDFKLKEAVVKLTDICKSKYWNETFNSIIKKPDGPEDENKSSEGSPDQVENNDKEEEEYENSVKLQKVASSSYIENRDENLECYNNFKTNLNEVKSEKININTTDNQDSIREDRSFTNLTEECNFSDILSRFKNNCAVKLVDIEKSFKDSNSSIPEENCVTEINEKSIPFDENELTDTALHEEINNIVSDLNTDLVNDNDNSFYIESPSLHQPAEDHCNLSTKTVNVLNQMKECDEIVEKDKCIKFLVGHCYDSSESDECKISSDSVQVIEDSETLTKRETDDDDVDVKITFQKPEMNYSNLFDVGDINFHLKLIKKEMKRRSKINTSNSEKKKNTPEKPTKSEVEVMKLKKSSSPKKTKHSKNTPEGKKLKSFPAEEYIPINSSGSTKFAVAPLDKINPYKTHPARNFKEEMLYGSRVKRYTNPQQYRIYQLKQSAARNPAFKQQKL